MKIENFLERFNFHGMDASLVKSIQIFENLKKKKSLKFETLLILNY